MPAVMLGVFAITLFCSATLLFFIEPMVGKMMLPLLGGTPAVWNTCMVFFQAILLAGYYFAHVSTTWLGPRRQARLQLVVLLLPFLSIVINAALFTGLLAPNEQLILGREGNPIPALLLVLTLSVGLPMFVVCTSAPLLQRWFSSTDHPAAHDPYFLYGASNFGSMLMLAGYPLVVEPYLTLRGQQIVWVIGYGLLAVLVAVCAFLMWKSRPAFEPVAEASTGATNNPTAAGVGPDAIKLAEKGIAQHRGRPSHRHAASDEGPREPDRTTLPLDGFRRLYWVALAVVPSSLMLGVTTYITTDIAAIPLLWVLPLTLYLMTFIVVFAHIKPMTQNILTVVSLDVLALVLAWKVGPMFFTSESIQWLLWAAALGICLFSVQILRLNDPQLIHRVMIMVMPLVVLLLLFMMLSGIKPGVVVNIVLHLITLFIVSMVCHGELARDRPAPRHLTEFFLWMSFGGVVGGLFNALVAPIVFNAIVEYQLMLMVACMLLPPLGFARDSVWARRADLALATVFFLVGGLLLWMIYRDTENRPDLDPLKNGPWRWGIAAILLGVAVGGLAAWKNWGVPPNEDGTRADNHWMERLFDVVLPLALMLLVLGLFWGLRATGVHGRVKGFANMLGMDAGQFRTILVFGLPAVLCYTFVERSVRFGLGVGAIVLAAGYSDMIRDPALFQTRSFFGVLRVEESYLRADAYFYYPVHRLVHGTTLHGEQMLEEEYYRQIPISYYHKTGPVGQVFSAYNTDPKRPFAVIGLGTGTMATYGLPGQRVDYFDIDPLVVDISFDTNRYFTFIEDASDRGVDLSLILGDARLTFEPKGNRHRLKPLNARPDKPKPPRAFGDPLTPDDRYGLIVVDAFSSDAIPVHLITREAIEIYLERLLEDGVVCIHISNRYLDLQPVLANIVEQLRETGTKKGEQLPELCGFHMSDDDDAAPGKNRSHWVAITRKKEYMHRVLHPQRWEREPGRQALLAAALWPAPAGTALASSCGLAYAIGEVVNVADKDKPVKTDWKPVETVPELERQIEEQQALLQKTTEANDKEKIKQEIASLREKARMTGKVGVWTDDYSNLLSVFSWK